MTRVVDPFLQHLRDLALRMGSRAEAILDKALRSVFEGDAALAVSVAADDLEIDRLDVEIDDAVLKILALQAPVAGDLREVVAIQMIANDLERVGDLARNIAKHASRLALRQGDVAMPTLAELGEDAKSMLRRALDAFSEMDAGAARAVLLDDDRIDREEEQVVAAALRKITGHPDRAAETVDVILIAKNLERVGDHATNIAEDVILAAEARNVKHAMKLGR